MDPREGVKARPAPGPTRSWKSSIEIEGRRVREKSPRRDDAEDALEDVDEARRSVGARDERMTGWSWMRARE
jgi:hypothetical protein